MTYIPTNHKDDFLNFQYNGGTDSITYQYLWSPLATWLLKFVPVWIAPNMITFSALVMLGVVNVIFMLPDQDDVVPSWKLILMAVSLIVYQHLDNIDGKQARKTKSSSPLGMLFDHGSDAVSAFLISIQVLKILHAPFWIQLLCLYVFVMSTYFCAMWSQYCVGFFKLTRINPVDQGLPAYAIGCIIGTQIDLKLLRQQHILGTYSQQILMLLLVLLIPLILYMSKDIFKKAKIPLSQVAFIPILYVSAGILILLVYNTSKQFPSTTAYPFIYSVMFFWSRNMINIQLSYITKQKYRVFNRGTNSFIVFCLIYVVFYEKLPISDCSYFIVMCAVEGAVFFQFTVRVLHQGAHMLGIYVFSLRKYQKIK